MTRARPPDPQAPRPDQDAEARTHPMPAGNESTSSGVLRSRHLEMGARFGAVAGRDAPLRYGDPKEEYDLARSAAVMVDRVDRAPYRVFGRDPVRMLQGLVTNDLAGAPAGRGVYAAMLTPKGRMVAELRLFVPDGRDVLLDTSADAAAELVATLRKYIPPLFARFEAAELGVLGIYGPASRDVLSSALEITVPANQAPEAWVQGRSGELVVRTPYTGGEGYDLLLERGRIASTWDRLVAHGVRPAGHETLETLRIEAGTPRWGAELTREVIPLEAGLRERAISETKGCYTGQEVIIRILHRGHVNWSLRGFLLGQAPVPAPDTPLVRPGEEKRVARVTSACRSPGLGQTIALGYARRELVDGAVLRLGGPDGREARLVTLPFDVPG